MSEPIDKSQETFDNEVRHIKHLNAIGDEDHLDQVGGDERCHVADVVW